MPPRRRPSRSRGGTRKKVVAPIDYRTFSTPRPSGPSSVNKSKPKSVSEQITEQLAEKAATWVANEWNSALRRREVRQGLRKRKPGRKR